MSCEFFVLLMGTGTTVCLMSARYYFFISWWFFSSYEINLPMSCVVLTITLMHPLDSADLIYFFVPCSSFLVCVTNKETDTPNFSNAPSKLT